VTAVLLLFAAVAAAFRVRAYDLFWHLAAGRWIAEHGRLPRSDPFRFTHDGAPWVDHEWLFQAVIHGLERLVGVAGLEGVRIGAAVGLAALLLVALRRAGVPVPWAAVAAMVAILGARPRLFLRPELVTLLAVPILLALLQELRRGSTSGSGYRRWLPAAALAVMVPLWANAHPGALAAPPLALAFLVGSRLPGGRRGEGPPVRWLLVLGLPALLTGGLLLNPHGTGIFSVPGAIGASLDDLGGLNPEWLPVWHPWIARSSIYFFAALAGYAALAAVTVRRARRLDPATGLTTLALAALACTSIRHQALFHLGAAFFAGECVAALARTPWTARFRPGRRPALLAIVLCLLATLWAAVPPRRGPLAPLQGRYALGFGVEPDRFPRHLADAVARDWNDVGNLYNNVAWGGYLLWRLYPPRRVFVDGRNEVDPKILRDLAEARRSSRAWDDLLARHEIDGAVLRYEERRMAVVEAPPEDASSGAGPGALPMVVRRTPNTVLFPRDRFALVAWDDAGMLLVRRTPERTARLARTEYRAIDPEDPAWTLARAEHDPAFRAAARAEAERRASEPPFSRRAADLAEALR
jgi:hypothetical protein